VLIRFRVENFRSIKEEQEISLVASALTEHEATVRQFGTSGLRLLPAAAVYGPNASGKSSLFDALRFMRTAVLDSHRNWSPDGGVPHEPFAFDRATLEPGVFVVDILVEGIRYEYGFSADSVRVMDEWLYAWPRGRRQELFTRSSPRDVEFSFNRALMGENRAISALTRPNSLFLSAAAQNNHPALLPIYHWFSQNLWIVEDSTRPSFQHYTIEQCRDEGYRSWILSLLRAADLGITDVEFVDGEDLPAESDLHDSANFLGRLLRRLPRPPRVQFWHAAADGGSSPLPFEMESRGTRTLFSLLGILTWTLNVGGTLVVDELDQSLHPELAHHIVNLFIEPASNPRNAQLVFNTHDTTLLDAGLLRRDQIWFTEKGSDGATHLFPLTDFQPRKQENLHRGYLQGRYGAVPSISSEFERFPGVG
jgi:uncharacterized protein